MWNELLMVAFSSISSLFHLKKFGYQLGVVSHTVFKTVEMQIATIAVS
jgi:hypothetical protein